MVVRSPAKVNLVLRVLGKRRDGFHEICTLFHRISLSDTLRIEKKETGIRLFCAHPDVPKNSRNLIHRAYQLLKAHHPFKGGVSVYLTKRIPVAAGLGGGSSNAASFLTAMNRLFRLNLTQKKLMELGASLGSDVPFFISGMKHALGQGRGERLKSLSFPGRLWFLLFPSTKGISTAKVYGGYKVLGGRGSLTREIRDVKIASNLLAKGRFDSAAPLLINDLEPNARRLKPSLRKTQETLLGLHLGKAYLSGSGPTFFLLFRSRSEIRRALRRLRNHPLSKGVIVCHTL